MGVFRFILGFNLPFPISIVIICFGLHEHSDTKPNKQTKNSFEITHTRRKISAHEFEKGGLLKPIVNTIDGTPTFLSVSTQHDAAANSNAICSTSSHPCRPQRLSRNELKHLDEKQLIFELVRY